MKKEELEKAITDLEMLKIELLNWQLQENLEDIRIARDSILEAERIMQLFN
ncbi:MAG: hypothetical protein AABY22_06355 [Nanoarchaeota archaeon]